MLIAEYPSMAYTDGQFYGLGQEAPKPMNVPNAVPFIGTAQSSGGEVIIAALVNGLFATAAFRAAMTDPSMPWKVVHGVAGGLLGVGTLYLAAIGVGLIR